jgi:long-chain acyl-CoA synthetase
LALAESRETVLEDCAAIGPTVINGVPYFFQQVRRLLLQQGRADDPAALRDLLGGRICCCNSGGAPLPDCLYDFYRQRGVPLLQGYGLTEASPVVATSSPQQPLRGSVGQPLPGTDVRIASDGEILTRGPHVMLGYWQDPPATQQVLRDGWLHTGDLGRLDQEGFLWITGRKKELIVLSVGKNVAPAQLESLLTSDPLIEQAMVVGDGRSYLTALIVPHHERLDEELSSQPGDDADGLRLQDRQVQQLFQQRIEKCLSCLSHHEQVRRFTLLGRSFTVDRGELTPKLSLRRSVIQQHFAEEIEAMYRPDPPY